MSKIVFFCIPAHGHTNPTLGVVRELIRRGHEVWYYSYNNLRDKIEATGATFVSCDEFDAEQRITPKDAARIGNDLAFSTKILVDTTLALNDTVMTHMQALQPDCIVADSMAVWGKAVAIKLGIPFVSSTTTFAFNQHSAKIMKQTLWDLIKLLFSMPKINRQLKRLQRKGYPINSILDIISNDNNTHTIVYTSPSFQPESHTFSDRYAFVGPSIRPAETTVKKTCDKLIYLSMGTVNNNMLFLYKECISAFQSTEYQVIFSVGEQIDIAALGELPENIAVYSHVDQIAILEQADVFISHCGMNSVNEALYFGVPLVMLPQTDEQRGVAARVAELEAGILVKELSAKSILQATEQLLQSQQYKTNAQKIAQDFHTCSGSEGAANKIEQVIFDSK